MAKVLGQEKRTRAEAERDRDEALRDDREEIDNGVLMTTRKTFY